MPQEPKIPGGYILLSRKIIESEIWNKPPLYLKVWIFLLIAAQHADYKQLRRGQIRIKIPDIIEACSWRVGYRVERPTKDQIYQVLNWFRRASKDPKHENTRATTGATMITTTRATHGMVINIDNYWFYQDSRNYEGNDEGNDASNDEKGTMPDNINKNDKNHNLKPSSSRNRKITYSEDNTYFKMADYFYKKVSEVAKAEGLEHLTIRADKQRWADDFRKLVEIDEVKDRRLIQNVMDWVAADSFWKVNVLSAKKFREKFSELALKMKGATSPKRQPDNPSQIDQSMAAQEWIENGGDPYAFPGRAKPDQ